MTAAQMLFTVIPASSKPREDMRPPSEAMRTTKPRTAAAPSESREADARNTAEGIPAKTNRKNRAE